MCYSATQGVAETSLIRRNTIMQELNIQLKLEWKPAHAKCDHPFELLCSSHLVNKGMKSVT